MKHSSVIWVNNQKKKNPKNIPEQNKMPLSGQSREQVELVEGLKNMAKATKLTLMKV